MKAEKTNLLKNAIKMEEDGKKYYLKCAEKTKNELGKKLFRTLADYENLHIRKIKEVHQKLKEDKKLEVITSTGGDVKKLRAGIFSEALEKIDLNVKPDTDDLSALKEGMRLEEISEEYYNKAAKGTDGTFEKRFYLTLAEEERGHYLLLFDTYEYFSNPEQWFIAHERPALEG